MDPVYYLDAFQHIDKPTTDDITRYIFTKYWYSETADYGIHDPIDLDTIKATDLVKQCSPDGFTKDSKGYHAVLAKVREGLKEIRAEKAQNDGPSSM